jgi:UDP-N-acetylmuramoylalanine--D-glutamate ligase
MIPADWKDGEVAVVGLGKSGVAASRLLAREGVRVYASDTEAQSDGSLQQLKTLGVTVETGRHDLKRIAKARAVVASPGVPPDAPPLAAAQKAGIPVVAELDLGLRFLRFDGTQVIAVTGTNGKTTTTALIGHLLRAAGYDAELAGNIGRPVCDVAMGRAPMWVALEVSSFQLHDAPTFDPDIGVLTNLAPDHLDRYKSVEEYYADKALFFRHAHAESIWILNGEDPEVVKLAEGAPGRRRTFAVNRRAEGWYDRAGDRLMLGEAAVIPRGDLKLLGDHNVANALAAALAAAAAGVPRPAIAKGLSTFTALKHRLEPVKEVNGVLWINDSKATNIASTLVGVVAMDRPFVLLLGGRHKGEPYTRLGEALKAGGKCRAVVAYGEAGDIVMKDLKSFVTLERGASFDDVMARARRLAQPGEVVLLSPACSSYDMFKNYEERGATFRRIVESW